MLQPKLMSTFMRTCFLLPIFAIVLDIQPAMADMILPDINAKYVSIKEENPTRDAGFVVGDVLDRTITLTIKKPYELVKESLPIEGYEHRYKGQISGIELVKISTEETKHSDGATHVLHLRYQIFTTGKLAKPAALRAEIIKMRNTTNKGVLQYRIPSYSFRISPLSVFGSVKLKEEMSPFIAPLLLDANENKLHLKISIGLLGIALLGLLYIFGMHAWLPRMGAPFAKAYRDIRKMPDTAEGLQKAVARVHESLNKTSGTSLFSSNLADFLQTKPAFAPVKQEIEQFFGLSRQVFFEDSSESGTTNLGRNLGESPKAWLQKFCRRLRDCERGLRPDLKSKASQ
jgi:mxaA protein